MDKNGLRRLYRHKAVSEETSMEICSTLLAHPWIIDATTLFLYIPLDDEVDITPLLHCGKNVALPFMKSREEMEFALFDGSLVKGIYGTMEPEEKKIASPDADTVMVVPALALGRDGIRLGRGMGCYDRYLSQHSVKTIGVVPSERLLDSVPSCGHDIRLDWIVTQKESFRLPLEDGSPALPSSR